MKVADRIGEGEEDIGGSMRTLRFFMKINDFLFEISFP